MKKLTITTADGEEHELKKLTGRHWRILSEFAENAPNITDADLLEKHAGFIAEFYDVTADDVLDMPLEEILPASLAIRQAIGEKLAAKMETIGKNVDEGDKNSE